MFIRKFLYVGSSFSSPSGVLRFRASKAKAQERARTADLVLTKDVLYQLSYLGISIESWWHMLLAQPAQGEKNNHLLYANPNLERETGFEPATPSLEGSCSSQLSYSRENVQ